MSAFDDILKLLQQQQRFNKSFGLGSQISEMLKAQEQIKNNFSGLSMFTEIAKSMRHHSIVAQPSLKAIHSIASVLQSAIPQSSLDAIKSINRQHEELFGSIRGITNLAKFHQPAFAQINNLRYALSGISGELAAQAAMQKNWTILDDFENITEKAVEFSNDLSEELDEEHQKRFQILLALVVSFVNRHKGLGVASFLIIDIFLRIAGIHQYYDFLKDKPQLATKEEAAKIIIKQDSIIHYIRQISDQLKQAKEYRITNCICKVRLKPKTKTLTIAELPKDYEVIVIQVQHKWVLVNYFDPKDNLPQTGWLMKKYLDKPE